MGLIDDPELTIAEVAELLQVPYHSVVQWRYRHRRRPRPPWQPFPNPEPWTAGGRPRFRRSKVEAWARATGRLPQPPPEPRA